MSDAARDDAAQQAAEAWLARIDAKDFETCWDQASPLIQNAITKEQWSQTMTAQANFGTVLSRELEQRTYATELPGAPDGEYVVLVYKTSFENKKNSVETITPRLEDDTWRVAGYFIR